MKRTKNLFAVATLLFGSMTMYAQSESSTKEAPLVRTISVDYKNEKGAMNKMFKMCVGAGRANEGLRADWQQQLRLTKAECDFQYIRMHGLFTDDMAVYKEDRMGKPEYNFMYIDALFDPLLEMGIKPFVELGFMPSALASGPETIFWWQGNVTPPKDYEKWEALVYELTMDFTERYGKDEVKTWYFEVWNEPNLSPGFWSGTQEEYFKLYQYAARGVKRVNEDYRVGGPATAGASWEPEMIEFCKKNNVPIDFISTHSYGVDVGFLDEYGQAGPRFTPFHGGFGLMTIQGIKKSAYHAYSFMNKLGDIELVNADSASWVCKNSAGDLQVLLWDFTHTLPDDMNNQQYYIQDLPAKSKGRISLDLQGIPAGRYHIETYKIGYGSNDPYTLYAQMGRPAQLNRQQVAFLKSQSNGLPASSEQVSVTSDGILQRDLMLTENEVVLVVLKKMM